MRSAASFLDLSRSGSLGELHDQLLRAAVETDEPPQPLLSQVSAELRDVDDAELPPRPLVALRLIAARAYDAAWLVLKDNAQGVVTESFGQNTLSGELPSSSRLPLTTKVEPPLVYAWLPGFRDPRHGAPDAAYDVTHLATPRVHLEEMWWDGPALVLAGTAWLRHLSTSQDDRIWLVCTQTDGRSHVLDGRRLRRADHVRGTGGELTRLAWSGWQARLARRDLPAPGNWRLALRLDHQQLVHERPLGPSCGPAVPGLAPGPGGAVARRDGRRLTVMLKAPAAVRAARRVLHPIARSARQR